MLKIIIILAAIQFLVISIYLVGGLGIMAAAAAPSIFTAIIAVACPLACMAGVVWLMAKAARS